MHALPSERPQGFYFAPGAIYLPNHPSAMSLPRWLRAKIQDMLEFSWDSAYFPMKERHSMSMALCEAGRQRKNASTGLT
jgi:hypothetical protein